MTKSTITRERLLEIIVTGPEASGAEQNELARMALAAMDSEPVFTLEVAREDYKGQKLGNHFGFITLDAARELKEGNYQLYTAQPAPVVPVVPDELLKEYLRLVQCMLSDYRDGNHGDAQRWIRHIAKASDVFAEKHGLSPWEMAKKTFAHHPAHCVCDNCINARSKWDYV
ncbi:hypothetical protein CQA02_27950 [Klebsiella variicola]|nr:hypothetical protein [Klebsiella variicola]PCO66013.1 hypothetical protein CQA02_27950 [Klebsiella variicola]